MKKISVRINTMMGWKTVEGVPVKVGNISDLFAATPYLLPSSSVLNGRWNITHIPSGCCYMTYARSVKQAVELFEDEIKSVGKERYQDAIYRAMKL